MGPLLGEITTMVKYGTVGIANTLLSIGTMWLLSLTGLSYRIYSPISYCIGVLCSFVLNTIFTFKKGDHLARRLTFFLATCVILTGVAQLIQNYLIEHLAQSKLIGIGCGMVFYTLVGYVINRLLVFRRSANIINK